MSPHEAPMIPWKELIIPQIFNFTVFMGILITLIKKPLRAHFANKNQAYEDLRSQSERARAEAEEKNKSVRAQIQEIESKSERNKDDALKDASSQKQKMIADAMAAAVKIQEEAEKMVQFELQRTISLLRQELVQQSAQLAEETLNDKTDEDVLGRLNEEFIEKIKAEAR